VSEHLAAATFVPPGAGGSGVQTGPMLVHATRAKWVSRVRDPSKEQAVFSGVVKSLWASVQGDPVFMRRVNGWLTVFWIVMIPVSVATGWVNSVVYVSALSLWALVSGHWAAWQAARVEVEQQRAAARLEKRDIPGRVVDRLVDETTLTRS
jgi:hypothetical protein